MVLLQGLNYDYSGQQMSVISTAIAASGTTLTVENTEGFADNDYIIIAPDTETSEIVQVNGAVSNDNDITITAAKFAHAIGVKIYRTNFNKMHFYECATATGIYTLIAGSQTELSYATDHTTYDYTSPTADYYYKRIFYNDELSSGSDIDIAEYWQVDDEQLYVTEDELRTYLQFDQNDFPNRADMRFFIKFAMKKIALDVNSANENILFISTLMLSKSFVLRALATKSVSKGYVQVNAEGRTITKAYQELVLDAENMTQEYKEFIINNGGRREATSTNYMDDTTVIDSWTRTDIINMMNGTTNAEDFQNYYSFRGSYSRS